MLNAQGSQTKTKLTTKDLDLKKAPINKLR